MPITPPAVPAVGKGPLPKSGPAEIFRDAHRMAADAWAERYPHWFLLPELAPGPRGGARDEEDEWVESGTTDVTKMDDARRRLLFEAQVFPIRKAQVLYPDMITIGRTSNHDIVLRDSAVSKFHAHFRVRGGVYYLVDADSATGTTIDGQRVLPRQPTLVVAGALISFGGLQMRFLGAEACYWAIAATR